MGNVFLACPRGIERVSFPLHLKIPFARRRRLFFFLPFYSLFFFFLLQGAASPISSVRGDHTEVFLRAGC